MAENTLRKYVSVDLSDTSQNLVKLVNPENEFTGSKVSLQVEGQENPCDIKELFIQEVKLNGSTVQPSIVDGKKVVDLHVSGGGGGGGIDSITVTMNDASVDATIENGHATIDLDGLNFGNMVEETVKSIASQLTQITELDGSSPYGVTVDELVSKINELIQTMKSVYGNNE